MNAIDRWAAPAVLVITTAACFTPALGGDWLNWDDDKFMLHQVQWRGLSPSHLGWMFTDLNGLYMPLSWMSCGLDYLIWGMNPVGYRITGMALHGVNALLVYLLIGQLARRVPVDLSPWARAAGALGWAIHPMRTESVCWIFERRDVLSGGLLILTTLCYVRAVGTRRSPRWFAASVTLFALSLLAKGIGMSFVGALVAIDLFPLGRHRTEPWRRLAFEKIPFLVLGVAAACVAYVAQERAGAVHAEGFTVAQALVQPGYRLFFSLSKMAVPVLLSPVYLFRVEESPWLLKYWGGSIVFVTATLAIWRYRKTVPCLAAWIAFAAFLLPTLGIPQIGPHFAADRNTYAAAIAFAPLLAWALQRAGPAGRGCGVLLVIVAGALTLRQSSRWRDSFSLWDHAVKVDARNPIALNNRGLARLDRGDAAGAAADFDAAVAIRGEFLPARLNRALVRVRQGRLDEAEQELSDIIARDSRHALAHLNRAIVRLSRGRSGEALADIDRAIVLEPANAGARVHRVRILASLGRVDEAWKELERAFGSSPALPFAHATRAALLQTRGDGTGAVREYDAALRQDPSMNQVRIERGLLLVDLGRFDDAAADFDEALRRDGGAALAYSGRGAVRLARGDGEGAAHDLEAALRLQPDCIPAYFTRARLHAGRGALREAIADYDEVIRRDARAASAYLGRGMLKRPAGDPEGAVADLSRAISMEPGNPDAWFHRALAQESLGSILTAAGDMRRALELGGIRWPLRGEAQEFLARFPN